MPKKLIDKMVDRFLSWKLPPDFAPDCHISFNRDGASAPYGSWPIGTNLLTAEQARMMFEHVLGAALPAAEVYATEEEGDAFTHGYFAGHDEAIDG